METKPNAIIVQDGRVVNPVSHCSGSAVVANNCGELENDVNRLLEVVHGCITGKGLMHSGEPDAGGARARPPEQAPPEATADSVTAASGNQHTPRTNSISATQNHTEPPPEHVETSPAASQALAPLDLPEQEEVVDRSGYLGPWYAIEGLCSDLVRLNHIADNLDGIMLQTLSCFRPNRADPSTKSAPGRAPSSGAKLHQRSCKCDKRYLQAERELGSIADLLPLDGGICRHSEIPDEIPLQDPNCNCRHCVGGEVVCRVPMSGGSFGDLGGEERGENCSLNIVNETA